MNVRPIFTIAAEIVNDWKKPNSAAKQYIEAMSTLNSITDSYFFDSGREIVIRFLSNASSWKGETAKRVKSELRSMAGLK